MLESAREDALDAPIAPAAGNADTACICLNEGLCDRGGGETGGAEPVGLLHRHGLCLEHRPGLDEHVISGGVEGRKPT